MHIFLESSRRAHVKPNATTVPFSRYSRSNGFLEHKLSDFGSLWVPHQMSMSNINLGYIARLRRAPNAKGEKTRAGHVYHHANLHGNLLHHRRDICPQTKKKHSKLN